MQETNRKEQFPARTHILRNKSNTFQYKGYVCNLLATHSKERKACNLLSLQWFLKSELQIFWWVFKDFLWRKDFPHFGHEMVAVAECLYFICSFRYFLSRKFFPQISQHTDGPLDFLPQRFLWQLRSRKCPPHLIQASLSCEWVAKCLLNWYVSLKLFSHLVHKYPSFLCLNFLWSLKAPELV